ncbi:MAG: type III-A CRISPR-associated protein Csm2 [Bacteroidaceae bacterium]|nr:type III-A CRISPR-associated protein Csm2 [Bacteroidaceae bacterium]
MSYLKLHPIQNSWITDKADKAMVKYAEQFAEHLATEERGRIVALTASQLRKFFGSVKTLQLKTEALGFQEAEFIMLKAKLAYAEGRVRQKNGNKELRIADFREVMDEAINLVDSSTDKKKSFANFINFFEAIVAYHKVYGKDKDKQ